jgi:hypothetical protein
VNVEPIIEQAPIAMPVEEFEYVQEPVAEALAEPVAAKPEEDDFDVPAFLKRERRLFQ